MIDGVLGEWKFGIACGVDGERERRRGEMR
jgi:hypothetical protein